MSGNRWARRGWLRGRGRVACGKGYGEPLGGDRRATTLCLREKLSQGTEGHEQSLERTAAGSNSTETEVLTRKNGLRIH